MCNRLLRSFGILATSCLVLALAAPGLAQEQWHRQYGGGYGYSRDATARIIRQAQVHGDQFVRETDRAINLGFMRITTEGRLNERSRDLERQINVVHDDFERTDDRDAVRSDVQAAMDIAARINDLARDGRLNYQAERQWNMLRSDLNRLARIYDVRQVG